MISLFGKHKPDMQVEKDLVYSMVRILSQNQGDVLYELLALVAPFYGEGSVLSVIESDTKDILATTQEEALEAIRHTARGVKDINRPHRYLREEKNAMYFRSPFQYIQVIPFRRIGKKGSFLLVEQEKPLKPELERCFEVLEIAARIQLYDYLAIKNAEMDKKTLLQTRDMLVERMKSWGKDEIYLGVCSLLNKDDIGLREGVAGIDRAMFDMADVLKNVFGKDCYRLADTKISVLVKGPVFEATGALQGCLDTFVERYPLLKVGAVLSPICDEVFRIMYLCEKACESCAADMVLVVRNAEDYLNTGGEVVEMIYTGRPREEGKEAFRKDTKDRQEEPCTPEEGLHESSGYVKYVFETGFEKMEPFDGL